MKNKKLWFILSGILISLIVIVVIISLIIKNEDKNIKLQNIILKEEWNLSYGERITQKLLDDEKYHFFDRDEENAFLSVTTKNDDYIAVGTIADESHHERGIIECYDAMGIIKWSTLYPNIDVDGSKIESKFKSILAISDGYIVIGTEDVDGPKSGFEDDYNNTMILKYDLKGNLIWNKKYNSTISMADLSNNLMYDFIKIVEINNKHYVIGNLYEMKISGTQISHDKQYGIVIEIDNFGKEQSLNKYSEGSHFYDAEVIDNLIFINSELGYELIDNDEYFYGSAEGLGIISFDEKGNFNQIMKYVESGSMGILYDYYKYFEYIDGIYCFVDPTTTGKILALNENKKEIFSLHADDGDKLDNYWLQDIETDGEYIYVYAYYYDMMTSNDMTDSAIIIFDKKGNYRIIDITGQSFHKLKYYNNSLLLVGNEKSFTKYSIVK